MTALVNTVVVIAKEPLAGRVKTRLAPPLTADTAADVAAAALRDTLACVERAPARERVLCFAGDPTGWAPPGWRVVAQPTSGGLDVRLVAAFAAVRGPAVLVGMDTPQLRPEHLARFDPARYDACLGPATDGGFWAIGFADPTNAAGILGVPMSTARTGAVQLGRLRDLGLRVQLLDELTDVDDIASAAVVAGLAPRSRFAAHLLAALDEDVA